MNSNESRWKKSVEKSGFGSIAGLTGKVSVNACKNPAESLQKKPGRKLG
jgi:hypothetical protein